MSAAKPIIYPRAAKEEHHWFVKELRSRFQQAGIDPDDFTAYMSFKDHRAKDTGVHAKEFLLNRRWREFFRDYSEANADDIHEHLEDIFNEWLSR